MVVKDDDEVTFEALLVELTELNVIVGAAAVVVVVVGLDVVVVVVVVVVGVVVVVLVVVGLFVVVDVIVSSYETSLISSSSTRL